MFGTELAKHEKQQSPAERPLQSRLLSSTVVLHLHHHAAAIGIQPKLICSMEYEIGDADVKGKKKAFVVKISPVPPEGRTQEQMVRCDVKDTAITCSLKDEFLAVLARALIKGVSFVRGGESVQRILHRLEGIGNEEIPIRLSPFNFETLQFSISAEAGYGEGLNDLWRKNWNKGQNTEIMKFLQQIQVTL